MFTHQADFKGPRALGFPLFNGPLLIEHPIVYQKIVEKFSIKEPFTLVCHGPAGIGKTSLTRLFYLKNNKPYDYCVFFDASTRENLIKEYRNFSFYYHYKLPVDDETSDADLIAIVKTFMSKHPNGLFIYDDADNEEVLAPFLPDKSGHVLITSRYAKWSCPSIQLEKLDQENAVELVKRLLKNNNHYEQKKR